MRACLACRHDQAESINRRLIEGKETLRAIAQFAGLSHAAIGRHSKNCVGKRLGQAFAVQRALREGELVRGEIERQAVTRSSLLDQVKTLEAKVEQALDVALGQGEGKTVASLARESARLCELKGRLAGVLRPDQERGNVNVQVLNLPRESLSSGPIASERWAKLTLATIADERRDAELAAARQTGQASALAEGTP